MLGPVPCDLACEGVVSEVVSQLRQATRALRVVTPGAADPQGRAANALRVGPARGLVTSGVDVDGLLGPAYAAAGDWAAATRDRFRALVRELEVRTILDVRPARTASEAAYAAARALPEHTEALRVGAELFNAVVYGDRVADASAYAAMTTLDETVTAAADVADLTEVGPVTKR